MITKLLYCLGLVVCYQVIVVSSQEFASYFANCHISDSSFDNCFMNALNNIRPFFKKGLPKYGVSPFDPFFANRIDQTGTIGGFKYNLTLKNVYEAGWTTSRITKLQTNFKKNRIIYTQSFPDKKLNGEYEFKVDRYIPTINRNGTWNLTLYDYIQTTTLTRKPRKADDGALMYDTPIRADVVANSCGNLTLHISHLAGGRPVLENLIDGLINTVWQPGFIFLKPFINNIVSTEFSKIFTKNFQNFPMNEIIR